MIYPECLSVFGRLPGMAVLVCVCALLSAGFGNVLADVGENFGSARQNTSHVVSKGTSGSDRALEASQAPGSGSTAPLTPTLPQALSQVAALCPCNLQSGVCDINCCCDPDCSQEVPLFTHCSVQKVSGDPKLCSQDAAVYTLTQTAAGVSQLTASVLQESDPGLLCVQSANYDKGMSFATPATPSEENFDGLFSRFVGLSFSSWGGDGASQQTGNTPGYSFGDLIWTRADDDQVAFLKLPASAGTASCLDTNPAAFLQDQTSACTRSFTLQDCTTLEALNIRTYSSGSIFSVKDSNAELVSVSVEQITLQSLEGAQTLLEKVVAASEYQPVFLEAAEICNQVVLQVKYTVRFDGSGRVLRVSASFVLGAVDKTSMPMEQKFLIQFVQDSRSDSSLSASGNPGYVVGLPLVAGWRTAEGIVQSVGPGGSLGVLLSSAGQDCLSGSTRRSPVLFGTDVVSGCTFGLEDGANCSLVAEAVLARVKGHSFPDHVASFGNSPPQNPMDWIPIEDRTARPNTQVCSIPVFYHLDVRWTRYGTLVNPQAQIVSVTETIQFNTSSLPPVVSVLSSVGFVDVSDTAGPGFRAPPTIDAKLSFDFFFPFV